MNLSVAHQEVVTPWFGRHWPISFLESAPSKVKIIDQHRMAISASIQTNCGYRLEAENVGRNFAARFTGEYERSHDGWNCRRARRQPTGLCGRRLGAGAKLRFTILAWRPRRLPVVSRLASIGTQCRPCQPVGIRWRLHGGRGKGPSCVGDQSGEFLPEGRSSEFGAVEQLAFLQRFKPRDSERLANQRR